MKKLFILLLIFTACKKEVFHYPSKDFFKEYNPVEINVDNLNFEELTDSIRNGLYEKEHYFIEINDSNATYKISPFALTGGYIKESNGLYIINDSIGLIKGMFPINDLSKYLKLHYENNGKEYFYASSYKWAYVKLILTKEGDSEKLKTVLLNLVKIYNQTDIENKDSISLNIILDYPLEQPALIPPPPTEYIN